MYCQNGPKNNTRLALTQLEICQNQKKGKGIKGIEQTREWEVFVCSFMVQMKWGWGAVPGKKELSLLNYKETFKKLNVYNLAGNQETI